MNTTMQAATGLEPTDAEPGLAWSARDVFSSFATGVTVLSVGGERMHGMTANAFTSVSLDPPLVLCCVGRTAVMHERITTTRHFACSVLGSDQELAARHFADKRRRLGAAQFEGFDWTPGPRTGAPLLDGAVGWLETELVDAHVAGDHTVFIGRVLSLGRRHGLTEGLIFVDGTFAPGPATTRTLHRDPRSTS